jgi:hypothetical protein
MRLPLWFADGSHKREPSAMKWNTPDWLFGLFAGMLFGLWVAMIFIEKIFEPSSDARSYIGIVSIFGYLTVVLVRSRRLRPKNRSSSIQS